MTAIIMTAGAVAGSALSSTTMERVRDKLSAPLPSDPVERYQLGFNAFDNPGPKFELAHSNAPRDYMQSNYEYGKTRNGKRMLVPGEPARKKDRLALVRDAQFEKEYFGGTEFAELGEFGNAPEDGYFLAGQMNTVSKPVRPSEHRQNPPVKESLATGAKLDSAHKSAGLETVAIQYDGLEVVSDGPPKTDTQTSIIAPN